MNFKQYLKESVEGHQIYDFYALYYISTHSRFFEKWEQDEIKSKFNETKIKLWEDICADGIVAVISELSHGIDDSHLPEQILFSQKIESFIHQEVNVDEHRLGNQITIKQASKILKKLNIHDEFSQEYDYVIHKKQDETIMIDVLVGHIQDFYNVLEEMKRTYTIVDIGKVVVPEMYSNLKFLQKSVEFVYFDYKNEQHDLSEVEKTIEKNFDMDTVDVVRKSIDYFMDDIDGIDIDWFPAYGGEKWGNIARELYEFYKENPIDLKMEDFDHIIDLAHNTGSWLDKFPNYRDMLIALDDKFEARTPEDFRDKIRDRNIRKWLGEVTRNNRR